MKVKPIPGEPTRFHVESATLVCDACKTHYNRLAAKSQNLRPEDGCRKRACPGHLEERWHLVDIAMFAPVGQCTCENWSFRLKEKITKLPPAELATLSKLEANALRCSHIMAAREVSLNLSVNQHETERLKNGNGQTEEDSA